MLNLVCPNQHIDIEPPHGSRDHIIESDIIKILFSLDVESRGKTSSIVNNVGTALVKKKILMLRSKETDIINDTDIYDTYKHL